jgi:hypothetical protein
MVGKNMVDDPDNYIRHQIPGKRTNQRKEKGKNKRRERNIRFTKLQLSQCRHAS